MEFVERQQKAADCLAQDKYDEAIVLYDQCIEANSQVWSNYWKLGLALLLSGQKEEAQACWLSAIVEREYAEIEGGMVEIIKFLENEGIERLESGKYEQSEIIFLELIELDPDNSKAYKNLGNAVFSQGKLEEAVAYYQKGLSLEGDADATTYYNLGMVFHQQGKLEEAIACFEKFLLLNPNSADALNNLGNSFQRLGKFDEGIACFQKALTLEPNNALILNNLGTAFQTVGKLEEALACYQKALSLEPNDAMAHSNLGVFFMEQHQFEKAMACYNKALEIDPDYVDFHRNRAGLLLRLGDYKRGFAEYEWRWRRKENPPPSFPQPLWDGSDLDGKTILLYAEQGFGDTIQFIRYAPLVRERGGRVIFVSQVPLVELLTTVAGIDKVVAVGTTLPQFDVRAPLLSLPYILGTTLETIPVQIPYISPLKSLSFKLETPDAACFRVGLVWAGNPENADDRNRSCSLKYFAPLLSIAGIAFYSLQKGSKVEEITQLSYQESIQDLSIQLNDFADTAAVVAHLDLIITVDTAVAHLAGALGRPVWVVLSYSPDWRWMVEREDSPWYPTMRLFRQNQPGNWQDVLERVAVALTELVNSKKS